MPTITPILSEKYIAHFRCGIKMPVTTPTARSKKIKKKTNKSRTTRAGLIFSVTRIYKILKEGNYARRVGPEAAVCLAASLEYLAAEILELAGKAAVDNDKKIIKPRHFLLAVKNDEDLDLMLKGVVVSEGGVLPHIHPMMFKQPTALKQAKNNQHDVTSQGY